MGYRYMRILLFFDLPATTSLDHKIYRKFIKDIKKEGFFRLQESVYVKMAINQQLADSTISIVKSCAPLDGNIMTLVVTEKQFSSINIIIGEFKTDVINTDNRIVKL